jgi:hypothetical protein
VPSFNLAFENFDVCQTVDTTVWGVPQSATQTAVPSPSQQFMTQDQYQQSFHMQPDVAEFLAGAMPPAQPTFMEPMMQQQQQPMVFSFMDQQVIQQPMFEQQHFVQMPHQQFIQ